MSKSHTMLFFLIFYIFASQLRVYYHIWLAKIIVSCLKLHLHLYTDLKLHSFDICNIQINLLHCVKNCTPSKCFFFFSIDINIQLLLISPLVLKQGDYSLYRCLSVCPSLSPSWLSRLFSVMV